MVVGENTNLAHGGWCFHLACALSSCLAITLWVENRPFFANTSLPSLAVSSRYGLRKAPCLSKKLTLLSAKSNHQT